MIELQVPCLPCDSLWSINPNYVDAFGKLYPDLTVEKLLERATDLASAPTSARTHAYNVIGDVAVIDVKGPLTKYRSSWAAELEATVMEDLRAQIKSAVADPSVKGILLKINSPGGVTGACAAVQSAILQARKVKPTAAYIERECSGIAYLIAMATGSVWAAPLARIGALACCELMLGWMFAHEDLEPELDWLPSFSLNIAVETITALEEQLLTAICECRQIKPASLANLRRGWTITAEQAEACGLVNEVLSFDAAVDRLHRCDVTLSNRSTDDE